MNESGTTKPTNKIHPKKTKLDKICCEKIDFLNMLKEKGKRVSKDDLPGAAEAVLFLKERGCSYRRISKATNRRYSEKSLEWYHKRGLKLRSEQASRQEATEEQVTDRDSGEEPYLTASPMAEVGTEEKANESPSNQTHPVQESIPANLALAGSKGSVQVDLAKGIPDEVFSVLRGDEQGSAHEVWSKLVARNLHVCTLVGAVMMQKLGTFEALGLNKQGSLTQAVMLMQSPRYQEGMQVVAEMLDYMLVLVRDAAKLDKQRKSALIEMVDAKVKLEFTEKMGLALVKRVKSLENLAGGYKQMIKVLRSNMCPADRAKFGDLSMDMTALLLEKEAMAGLEEKEKNDFFGTVMGVDDLEEGK